MIEAQKSQQGSLKGSNCNMFNVGRIEIRFEGKFNLDKLTQFGFETVPKNNFIHYWKFDGVMHKYPFIPFGERHLRITIIPKSRHVGLPLELTYKKLTDGELLGWIKAIQE